MIHHGGLGTTFSALRSGAPAVVVPQAFDQAFNARLVESAGAGLASSSAGLTADLAAVLDGQGSSGLAQVQASLISSDAAAWSLVDRIDAATE